MGFNIAFIKHYIRKSCSLLNHFSMTEQIGNAGLLFDPNNIEDMAEKICRVWTDEDLRNELIKKGYERIKDMTLNKYANQWEQVIEELLRKVKI
jgi:glycosyltransferase involved in cell wall biosynthesis